jgi:hypothetical protein
MWLTTLFSSQTRIPGGGRAGRTRPANNHRKPGDRTRPFVPQMEILEDRRLPSTLTVLNTNDKGPGSLRDTITKAQSGDTIVFAPSLDGQTITLTSDQLTINNSLDIEGPGAGLLTISGNNQNRLFNINEGLNVTINGLTLTQGRAVGSVGVNLAAGGGGAILNAGSVVGLANDVFADNVSLGTSNGNGIAGGGAISNTSGSVTVSNSTFLNNRADGSVKGTSFAAGGAIFSGNKAVSVTVIGCTFTGNQAIGANGGVLTGSQALLGFAAGGALDYEGLTSLTVTDSTFTGNEAIAGSGGSAAQNTTTGVFYVDSAWGGAIMCHSEVALVVSGSRFTGNEAIGGSTASGFNTTFGLVGAGTGGAIFTEADTTITDSGFVGNQALGGSGDSYTSSSGNVLVGCGGGGAIYEQSFHPDVLTSLSASNCTFTNNQAIGGAGSAGGNGADGLGGALANVQGAALTVSSCTLSGNEAIGGAGGSGAMGGNGLGGGLYNDGSSTLTVTGSTITANQATGGAAGASGSAGLGEGGGAYFAAGGVVCLDLFTSISGNTASTGDNDVFGSCTPC